MAQLQDTAGDLRKAANFFKGIIAAADVIERIGSLENATAEAKAALAVAEKERDAAMKARDAAKAKAKAEAERAEADAADALIKATNNALKAADDILAEANARAESMCKVAAEQADSAKAAATASVAGAKKKLATVDDEHCRDVLGRRI